jgi:hypothetical protein
VAYSSRLMSVGLRWLVLIWAMSYVSASTIAVNGTVRLRLPFASSGNSPLTTKCTATSSRPYTAAGTTQVRSARPGPVRRRAIAMSRVTAMAAGASRMVSLVIAPKANKAGGEHVPTPAVGEQAAQHAGLGQRLGGVPADADDQAEVGGEGEPPQAWRPDSRANMPPSMAMAATATRLIATRASGYELVLASRHQPGHQRVPDAGVPVGLVHGDAERGRVPVGRVQREPVIELPVIARGGDQQQTAGS